APLGPISARRSPGRTASSTLSTARRPPNVFDTACSRSANASFTGAGTPARAAGGAWPSALATEGAEHAAGGEQDDADGHGPQDEQPAFGVHAHEVLKEDDHRRAQRRSRQRAGAAQGHHQQRLYGGDELDVHRADEAVVVGPEHAGEAREG